KLFWWFNQGAAVDISVTPKPHYAVDGNKAFGITGDPPQLAAELESTFGPFPFPQFWGPMAGLKSTRWIAEAAFHTIMHHKPTLTPVPLPHLDYDPQRFGPGRRGDQGGTRGGSPPTNGTDMPKCVRELDDVCELILDAATSIGAKVWVVSEYGHCDVSRP